MFVHCTLYNYMYTQQSFCVAIFPWMSPETLSHHPPVHDVGEEVVVPEPVLDIHLLVVDSQCTIKNASLLKFKLILS